MDYPGLYTPDTLLPDGKVADDSHLSCESEAFIIVGNYGFCLGIYEEPNTLGTQPKLITAPSKPFRPLG